jgi:hypothetical protein
MQMKTAKWLMTLLVFFSIALHVFAEEKVVVADGEAAGSGLNAKEKSLDNALRNAIEKGFGVYIDSTTLTENAALISDDITAETRGFVRSYDILEERTDGSLYITTVRAVIAMDKIWESDSLNLLLKRMGAPRFVIFSTEYVNGEITNENHTRQKMTEVLVRRGFHLIDSPEKKTRFHTARENSAEDVKKSIKAAKKINVEFIVKLKANSVFEKKTTLYGKELTYYNGICEAGVIQVDSGKIISSSIGKAVRGAETPDEAVHDSLSFSSLNASEELIKGMLSAWAKYLNNGRSIEVIITGISVSKLARIMEKLKSLEGVGNVSQRAYANRTAQLEIKSKHKALYLAESIENLPAFNVKITHFSDNKIQLKLR